MRLILTGDDFFLQRHSGLIAQLGKWRHTVVLPKIDERKLLKNRIKRRLGLSDTPDLRNPRAFIESSAVMADQIKEVARPGDLVLHLFSSFAPCTGQALFVPGKRPPYFFYLDFTMAQALEQWPSWAIFSKVEAKNLWLEVEEEAYRGAVGILTMSEGTRDSLIERYGVPSEKIEVVSSGVNDPGQRQRRCGDRSLRFLCDGSDPLRKGEDRAVAFLRSYKRSGRSAELFVLGSPEISLQDDINRVGRLAHREVQSLLSECDVLLGLARCDPYPTLVLEASSHGVVPIVSTESGLAPLISRIDECLVVNCSESAEEHSDLFEKIGSLEHLNYLSEKTYEWFLTENEWNVVGRRIIDALTRMSASLEPS
ncbi:MAG: glycosyltransferase family 4 protein [Rubrivivax sp.]|nr:glycosyltransferase family 4 protein [Rubrivivax sp.]